MATQQELAETMPTKFLRAFFAEKEIPETTFTVDGPSGENSIPNMVVIEHIAQCGSAEANQIADVLRRIDFANGDVNHFLAHLAQALAA